VATKPARSFPDFAPLNPGYRVSVLFVPQGVMVMTAGATAGII
jgi:hypothetical protein